MEYSKLKSFLEEKMKMSHIYQPVMIRYLLANNGIGGVMDIAKDISRQDPSQVEYYKAITNNMVGRVLRNHQIVAHVKGTYILTDFASYDPRQIDELIEICNRKLKEYLERRGSTIWEHRSRNRKYIPGSIKYGVLKRAGFRCELCGVMHTEKALEVDHIVPKNTGGEDSINNYQALCYTCNATKRDLDSTDFRGIDKSYAHREESCIFCKIDKSRIIRENNLAYMIYDLYPVTDLHALIIPKRHFADYFEIRQAESNSVQSLLLSGKSLISETDGSVNGFNIGINSGKTAGQTIFHSHIHLIPRRQNDVEDPSGGIRHLIPDKGHY